MGVAQSTLSWHLSSSVGGARGYRGPDRRRASTPVVGSRAFAVGLPIFLVVSHAAALAAAWQGSWSVAGRAGPTEWLTASVAVITALASAIYAMRWRLVGDASALWIAAALGVYSAINVAFPGLVQTLAELDSGGHARVAVVRTAAVFVVMSLLATAALAPAVDARVRPRRVAATAAGFAAVGAVAASAMPDFRLLLGPAMDRIPVGGPGAFGQVGIGLLWLGLGTLFLFRLSVAGRQRAPWIGVMLLGLAEARLALAVSIDGDPAWMLASQLFRLFGVAAALGGGIHELQLAFAEQRSKLQASLLELSTEREERRIARASAEERAHDLRSALTGIGGAAVTLERYHAQLSDEERASLASAVAAEIARLQQIVGDVRTAPTMVELARVDEPLAVCARSHGHHVELDVPDGMSAAGRACEVAEIVQNLIENAHRHGRGPIAVRARRRGPRVEVRVEDHGPGVASDDVERIFERGYRADLGTNGSGLGLFNARNLAREQDGDLWVENRANGGASFVLALPIAASGDEHHDARGWRHEDDAALAGLGPDSR